MIVALRRMGLVRMRPRDPGEPNRTSSSLELYFDLAFVVCVSVAADRLLADESVGRFGPGVAAYAAVFWAIWWAWVSFAWFASTFDTDDWLYRLTTIVQMAGVLVLAAGIAPAFDSGDFRTIVAGYVVMRLAMVAQWLRAARAPERRRVALRTAAAITGVQVLWVLRLVLPEHLAVASFLVIVVLELLVPVWADRGSPPPWHARHIAERHGLFTLIVLGECLLSVARAAIGARVHADDSAHLLLSGGSALVIISGLWWTYFSRTERHRFRTLRSAFSFGYAHYVIFASAGALAAGLEVDLSAEVQRLGVPVIALRLATTLSVMLFVLATVSAVLRNALRPWTRRTVPLLAVAAAATALLPHGVQWCALVVVAIVVVLEVDARHGERSR